MDFATELWVSLVITPGCCCDRFDNNRLSGRQYQVAKKEGGVSRGWGLKLRGSTIFTALVVLVMAWALFEAKDFPFGGRIYPWLAGSVTFVLALWLLVSEVRRMRAGLSPETGSGASMDLEASDEPARERYGGFTKAMGWILGLWLSTWLLGWQIGITVFFIAYLVFLARARWFLIPILAAIMMLILFYFDKLLGVFWPQGILIRWLELPFF